MEEPVQECQQNTIENHGNQKQLINQEKQEASNNTLSPEKSDHSEYDSAGSYSDNEDDKQQRKNRSRGSEQDSESENSVILEREEGDGQESVPQKKVDDDEDKKNPQYIPKRGTFYEHDDRTAEDGEEKEAAELEKVEKETKKKVWQDKKERWSHDRFNDSEQAPKSKSELIATYGYDIRNEDGPPRARRRRRYGRGPNKYTRNWEDEDAYGKPQNPRVTKPKTVRPKTSRSTEEFPPLSNNLQSEENQEEEKLESEYNYNKPVPDRTEPPKETNGNIAQSNENRNNVEPIAEEPYQNKFNQQQRIGSGRVIKPKKEIKDSDYRGFTTKTRQVRNLKTDQQKILPPTNRNQKKDDFIQTQNFTNKNNNMQDLEKEMTKLNVQESSSSNSSNCGGGGVNTYKGNKHNSQRQGSVPPRLQNEQKGPKRYSSMRQRSLPETANPPNFPTTFYPNEYNQPTPPQGTPPNILHQNPPIHQATPQLPPIPQQVPVTAAPLLQPQFPPPFAQAPPPFLQPGVAPPPFIPPQQPQIINYVQGQPPFTPNYQGYQQQFNPVTQPAELYQPQGGITYYSTDQQQIAQRSVPQKRPKAAIPIVAPPGTDGKGRGRKEDDSGISEYSEKVIVDNNEEVVEVQQ